jgi:hypothetical protein
MKVLIFVENNVVDCEGFTPVSGAAEKILDWLTDGVEVEFVTSIHKFMELKKLDDILKDMGLHNPKVHSKPENKKFIDFVKDIKPALVIENENNCGDEKTLKERLKPEHGIACFQLGHGLSLKDLTTIEEVKAIAKEIKETKRDDTY